VFFVKVYPILLGGLILGTATVSGFEADYGTILQLEDLLIFAPIRNLVIRDEGGVRLTCRYIAVVEVLRLDRVPGGRKVEGRYPSRCSSIFNLYISRLYFRRHSSKSCEMRTAIRSSVALSRAVSRDEPVLFVCSTEDGVAEGLLLLMEMEREEWVGLTTLCQRLGEDDELFCVFTFHLHHPRNRQCSNRHMGGVYELL